MPFIKVSLCCISHRKSSSWGKSPAAKCICEQRLWEGEKKKFKANFFAHYPDIFWRKNSFSQQSKSLAITVSKQKAIQMGNWNWELKAENESKTAVKIKLPNTRNCSYFSWLNNRIKQVLQGETVIHGALWKYSYFFTFCHESNTQVLCTCEVGGKIIHDFQYFYK